MIFLPEILDEILAPAAGSTSDCFFSVHRLETASKMDPTKWSQKVRNFWGDSKKEIDLERQGLGNAFITGNSVHLPVKNRNVLLSPNHWEIHLFRESKDLLNVFGQRCWWEGLAVQNISLISVRMVGSGWGSGTRPNIVFNHQKHGIYD